MEFRKDLNGLRSIAVIAVILFHFDPTWAPGGFAGVDIFFVISGYLMTKIIFSRVNEGTFSITSFYLSRAKRIIPALVITCACLMVIGWLFLAPKDYRSLSADILSSLTFVSNFWYLDTVDYFNDSENNNFLLHSWSLSVEWQFYLLYPILLLILSKFTTHEFSRKLLLVLLGVSFALSVYITFKFSLAAYYMLPTRAWEMLAGGAAYLYSINFFSKHGIKTEFLGLLLILASYFTIDKFTPWPGFMAAVPVLGAFLIIQASRTESFLLGTWINQKLGNISYSLYLVHWPVLIFTRKLNIDLGILPYLVIVFLLSYCLSLVERIKNVSILKIGIYGVIIFAATSIFHYEGIPSRVPEQFQLSNEEYHKQYYGGSGYPVEKIFYINAESKNYDFIFTGDSFGLQYAKAIEQSGLKSAAVFHHGCTVFPNYTRYRNNKEEKSCSAAYLLVKQLMKEKPDADLIIAHNWDGYKNIIMKKGGSEREALDEAAYRNLLVSEIKNIIEDGGYQRSYYLIGTPQAAQSTTFDCLSGANLIGYRLLPLCKTSQKRENVPVNTFLNQSFKGANVHFIDPNDVLCEKGECLLIKNMQPMHSDKTHLSIYGADLTFELIKKRITAHEVSNR